MSVRRILLIMYAFIAGIILGGGLAFFIIVPAFRIILATITGSDVGPQWTIYFINMIFLISIIGGIYISEKWCLDYIKRKSKKRD